MENEQFSPTTRKMYTSAARQDSIKAELEPIPENRFVEKFVEPSANTHLVNLSFRELSYSVTEGFFKRKKKILLNQINGKFCGGKLTALMGASGAGKSTLISILSGYTTTRVTGTIYTNDEIREEHQFRDMSCYIMQEDKLQPLLTVIEAMTVAANLKLSRSLSLKEKMNRIKDILDSMNLWEHRFVKTSSLSGGQRKRLSLALELVNNPQIILLDEPTSGLDSLTSKQCVKLFKDLAQAGKTVICSIHQPSGMILELFDHLYILSGGRCIYQGAVRSLLPYLAEIKLLCPPYHNPGDYVLEVATGEHGDFIDELVRMSENGLNEEWNDKGINSIENNAYDNISALMASGRVTPVRAPKFSPFLYPGDSSIYDSMKSHSVKHRFCAEAYPTSFLYQLAVLLKRACTIIYRDKTLTYNRIFTHLGIALFLGTLCYGIGEDGSKSMAMINFNLMFFSVMFLMFTAFNSVVTTFPSEMPILTQEYFNKWYCLKSYYIAASVADIPIQILATLIYAMVTYYMTKQPLEMHRITAFLFMCILISITAQSFGFFVGACMDLKNSVIFGPFCLLPFTIFSGFFFKLSDCPKLLRWMFHISFLKYGFEGLILSIFGYDRQKLPCSDEYCHYVHPKKFLQERDMDKALYFTAVMFFLALIIVFKIIGYFALKIRIKVSRQNSF